MKFKFKPQTGILVAGILAATYAEACYYQTTSAVCIAASTTVDNIYWNNPFTGNPTPVTASADWTIDSGPGHYVAISGAGAYQGYVNDGGSIPNYCTGPVHFTDASGNTASVASWSVGALDSSLGPAVQPSDRNIYEGTVGSYGCP